jgi:hypothetical protein
MALVCLSAQLFAADPALTIYNRNFAVIREIIPLNLQAGRNAVSFTGVTGQLEPDSVVIRDPGNKQATQVIEQNYRNDPVSQERLLDLYEGKTIEFVTGPGSRVSGKIIRSGYTPPHKPQTYVAPTQPIIETDGKLQFQLPGLPIFPALANDTILKPALNWILYSAQAARFDAELSYITAGLSWSSDYNLVSPEVGDTVDLVGWVTLDNQSGKQFDHARIKLMAGDVNKVQPLLLAAAGSGETMADGGGGAVVPKVTEKSFEDYHLYTLPEPATIRDRETKQVEFVRASGVQSKRIYVYDGARMAPSYNSYQRQAPDYGTQSDPHVWIMREFANSATNHLGIPLPRGRVRFYRRDQDGQLEFTGENEIDHTPKDETVRIYTGNAFDLIGERRQTNYAVKFLQQPAGYAEESFEIKVRNHKKEGATVLVVEHLYRWSNWAITQESDGYRKIDSKTIEFEVALKPDEEKIVTYTVHYTW